MRETRMKRASGKIWPSGACTDDGRSYLAGELQILELISLGAPLPKILNNLCVAIDVEIGDVISLVSLADEDENHFCSVTQRALEVGLDVFSSTGILSIHRILLGTLDIYACDPRRPTPHEHELIERASHLAALALQQDADGPDFANSSRRPKSVVAGALEIPPFVN